MLKQTYETVRNLVNAFENKWIPVVAFFIIGAGTGFGTFVVLVLLVMVLSASNPVKRVRWYDTGSNEVILAKGVLVAIAAIKLITCIFPTWVWVTFFVIIALGAIGIVLKK